MVSRSSVPNVMLLSSSEHIWSSVTLRALTRTHTLVSRTSCWKGLLRNEKHFI